MGSACRAPLRLLFLVVAARFIVRRCNYQFQASALERFAIDLKDRAFRQAAKIRVLIVHHLEKFRQSGIGALWRFLCYLDNTPKRKPPDVGRSAMQ
jgi:hypothetical protein